MPDVYLGLGSNVGDRLAHLQRAVVKLAKTAGIQVTNLSSVYETEPVGVTDQGWFLNAVVQLQTTLTAAILLAHTQGIERDLGRVMTRRWGPRIIDLDILLYGKARVKTSTLEIPHPEICQRAFVMIPLLELDAEIELPDGTGISTCLARLSSTQHVRLYAPPTALHAGPTASPAPTLPT